MVGMEMAVVQVIENRTDIAGQIQSVRDDPTRPEHRIVTIDVHGSAPIEGYANMFGAAAGTRLDVLVKADQANELAPGKRVRCRIRRAGPATIFSDSCAVE